MKGYLVVLEVAAIYKPGCKQELLRVLLDREDFERLTIPPASTRRDERAWNGPQWGQVAATQDLQNDENREKEEQVLFQVRNRAIEKCLT
jgi:hypothetical protein